MLLPLAVSVYGAPKSKTAAVKSTCRVEAGESTTLSHKKHVRESCLYFMYRDVYTQRCMCTDLGVSKFEQPQNLIHPKDSRHGSRGYKSYE